HSSVHLVPREWVGTRPGRHSARGGFPLTPHCSVLRRSAGLSEFIPYARILVVDDEPANVRLVERILEIAGYSHVVGIRESSRVRAVLEEERPDLILLDLHMPGVDGFSVLEQISSFTPPD